MSNEIIAEGKSCDERPASRVQPLPSGTAVGAEVTARDERWIVRAVVPHEDCTELHLSSARDFRDRVLLWPFDRPVAHISVRRLQAVRLRRWWTHVQSFITAARVDGLRARAAGARALPYQIAPALALVQGASRIMLADEVGLGKTVQAGWIISDLLQRQPDARVLIAAPAGLRHQWQSELSAHFGIESVVADASWLRRSFADLPADVDPWSVPDVYVTSIDFLKRPDVLRSLERQTWDALIVDEAHIATAPTERYAALERIASRARIIVVITATPFSGDAAAFASLVALGTTSDDPPLMFRRSREDVAQSRPRRHRFAAIRISRAERTLQRSLERYTKEVWNTMPTEGARLAMTLLRKRALSSPEAVARSLQRRRELLSRGPVAPRQLTLFDQDRTTDDEEPLVALGAPGLADEQREDRWLAQLAAAAHAAPDSKRRYLARLLRRLRGEAAIVFTEYRDTLRLLAASFPGCLILHGGMTTAERAEVQARFNRHGGVLLATDAASEGLNLQQRCRLVVCYELPWNPARLEQRIGRVDRIGQSRRVHAITLVARDTAEHLVLATLVRRLARVAATLGERDRLAGFLTDARTAGIVIGGSPSDLLERAPLPRLTIGPASTGAAIEEARRLSSRTREAMRLHDGGVRVAALRATSTVREGFVFVFACSAITSDGRVVDCHPALVHVPARAVDRPRRAAAARDAASDAIRRYEQHALDVLELSAATRLAHVRRVHAAIIDRAIAREQELMDWLADSHEIQPGLFDRRAVTLADEDAAARQQRRFDHERRIAALSRARTITPRVDLVAVLLVHAAAGLCPPASRSSGDDQ